MDRDPFDTFNLVVDLVLWVVVTGFLVGALFLATACGHRDSVGQCSPGGYTCDQEDPYLVHLCMEEGVETVSLDYSTRCAPGDTWEDICGPASTWWGECIHTGACVPSTCLEASWECQDGVLWRCMAPDGGPCPGTISWVNTGDGCGI